VQRISVSLTESVFCQLDQLVAERGWESRSKAISVMVTQSVLEHREEKGDTLMAGTITIVYDESQGNLLQRLAELERRFLDEVISSLHVQLENDHRIEVLLVQGPACTLQTSADQ
jgi:CopG family transcriptional regulator, nickel-responsive regulator